MPNEFAAALTSSPLPKADPRPLSVLDEFCAGIKEATNCSVFCRREPGFLTFQGQEYRITVRSDSIPYDRILLRAYVPLEGWAVTLDLYDDHQKTCPDELSLREELKKFLLEDTTRETIGYYSRQ